MAEKYKELTRQVSSGKYSGTEAGDQILGAMMALSPQTSTDAMALLIPLAYCSIFTNAGISIDPNKITRSCPSSTTLKEFVTKAAADSKYLALSKINKDRSRKVFLICDKGPYGNFVKVLSWYNFDENIVETFNIDNDEVGGTSVECAQAIKHSMVSLCGEEEAEEVL
jgi:hypothetical protein